MKSDIGMACIPCMFLEMFLDNLYLTKYPCRYKLATYQGTNVSLGR